jgi:hypothetical protein
VNLNIRTIAIFVITDSHNRLPVEKNVRHEGKDTHSIFDASVKSLKYKKCPYSYVSQYQNP